MKIISQYYRLAIIFLFLIAIISCVSTPQLPTKQEVQSKSYLTATEAYNLIKKDNQNTLFIDVRTPNEVASEGMLAFTDANVPYLFAKWNKELGKAEWVANNDFVAAIEKQLHKKHLDKQNTVILACREGRRSAKAARMLLEEGYKNVYHIEGGIDDDWEGNWEF